MNEEIPSFNLIPYPLPRHSPPITCSSRRRLSSLSLGVSCRRIQSLNRKAAGQGKGKKLRIRVFRGQDEKQTKLLCFEQSPPSTLTSLRAYDREHGCVNSSMVFEWLGACDCSTSFALRAFSTCLCVKLHLSAIRSRELKHRFRLQEPSTFQKETRRGLNEVAYSQPKATQKHHPFPASGCTQNTKAPT